MEFTINHQKTKLTISRLMSCFHQLPGRSLCASILYHFFFFSSGNSCAILTPTCICYSYRILTTEVNLWPLERLRFTFTPNGKREFVPRDEVFPLIVVYCFLLVHRNKWFHASFIHKNRSGLFLSSYFLF